MRDNLRRHHAIRDALTQGDPSEPYGPCRLAFAHSGRDDQRYGV